MRISNAGERRLGPQEALFAELTRRGNGAIQLVCMAEFEKRPDPDAVRSALQSIHRRHPMLQARIEDREVPWWVCDVPFEGIDIRVEAAPGGLDVETFYAAEAARPIDVRGDCTPAVPGNVVGEYVAGIALMLGPGQIGASLLETARKLQEQFRRNRPPSLLMEAHVPPETTRGQVDAMAAASPVFARGICVSDIGDANRLSGRRLGFSRLLVMPSQNHGIHPVMVAIVTTSEGACLSFGYDAPLRTAADAHAFAGRYLQALDALAAGG
jgi:hypothetical protein